MKEVQRALIFEVVAPLYFELNWEWRGTQGSVFMALLAFYQQKHFLLLLCGLQGCWQGSLISCPVQHMVLLSVVKVQTFTENYRASEKGWRRSPFHFLSCRVPGLLMQSASTSRVFTIYAVHYLTVQDYFHYWDWQAASCQARTGVFFSISLNELPSFGSTHWPLTKETYYSKEDITWGADICAPKFL